jgi:surfeit locus 1 family protein
MFLKLVFKRRWFLTTLLVIAALGVLIRLGLWQLDRLHQRREFNAKVVSEMGQPPLDLTIEASEDLSGMQYRHAVVEGEYDHSNQVILINQVYQGKYGARLFTPLHILGSDQVILVDRGWIPAEEALSGTWDPYDEPGLVKISGVIRLSQIKPDFGSINDPTPVPGGERIKRWNLVNLDQMAQQLPYPILDVYLQASPDPSWTRLPYRTEPELDLTDGSHLSYALQWFTFAAILAVGYPLYLRREENGAQKKEYQQTTSSNTEELIL